MTFHNLDGKYFTLGSHEFVYDKDSISFSEADSAELIRMLGYDAGKYRFTSARWQGKEYKDKDGITCRDAYAAGQQYASSYKAVYADDVENGKLYTSHAVYTCEFDAPAEEAPPTYVVQATAYYQKADIPLLITIGIVIGVVLVVAIIYILSRKQKKEVK